MAYNLLLGKTVIVTGCSTGIGRAVAIRQSKENLSCSGQADSRIVATKNGANLVLHHHDSSTQSDIEEVAAEVEKAGGKSVIVAGDISDPSTATAVRFSPPFLHLTHRMSPLQVSRDLHSDSPYTSSSAHSISDRRSSHQNIQ